MSDPFQDVSVSEAVSKPASNPHLDDTVDRGIDSITPRRTHPGSKQQKQKQPQPLQPQAQAQMITESPTKSPKKKKRKTRTKRWSPEKLSPVHHQTALSSQWQHVDTTDWTQAVVIDSRPRCLDAPIVLRNDNHNGFDFQTDKIQKQLNGFQFPSQLPDLRTHPRPEFSNHSPPFCTSDFSYLRDPHQIRGACSPEISPKAINAGPNITFTCAFPSPVCQVELESPTFLPHYASFFRPRLSLVGDLIPLHSPIPEFDSIGQAMAIRKALTKFHMGILLADEWAGENERTWFVGLRDVVEENMPVLRHLGVKAHQIVFYYHGQGNHRVGNNVWDAIMIWQIQQHMKMPRRAFWSSESGDIQKQEIVSSGKQEELEPKEQESRQEEGIEQKEAEHEKMQRTNKEAQKWNDFAKQEASRSLICDGIIPRRMLQKDEGKDDSGIIW